MCSIYSHEKNSSEHDDGSSSGGYPLPSNSTTEALVFLIATTNFIVFCLQDSEQNFLERSNMYFFAMKTFFSENPS